MSYTSYLNNFELPRGIRNNNPGNLVKTSIPWQGKIPHSQNTDSRFEQFVDLRHGVRALMRDIITDYEKGLTTITSLISEFAPSFENNTAGYINSVSNMIGIGSQDIIPSITKSRLIGLSKAIVFVENDWYNGQNGFSNYVSDKDYEDAFQILGRDLPTGSGSQKKKK